MTDYVAPTLYVARDQNHYNLLCEAHGCAKSHGFSRDRGIMIRKVGGDVRGFRFKRVIAPLDLKLVAACERLGQWFDNLRLRVPDAGGDIVFA